MGIIRHRVTGSAYKGMSDAINQVKKVVQQVKNDKRVTRLTPTAFRVPDSPPAISTEKENLEKEYLNEEVPDGPLFDNPFTLDDFGVFDDVALKELFRKDSFGVSIKEVALALHGDISGLAKRLRKALPIPRRYRFWGELNRPASLLKTEEARRKLLDAFFWELTYWKTPELYEELTAGENLHPGIFKQLEPFIRGKTVLDAGAGSGRASFDSLHHGAQLVYAVEPSPGLLEILKSKLAEQSGGGKIVPLQGRFEHLPLSDNTVDVALSSSAFTADPEQGGEPGLKELLRVTRDGGRIVIIWPRPQDYEWLEAHGFSYVSLPGGSKMKVSFPSMRTAWRVARRFYARNSKLMKFLKERKQPEVPFSVLGFNPPHDFCWLVVHKT